MKKNVTHTITQLPSLISRYIASNNSGNIPKKKNNYRNILIYGEFEIAKIGTFLRTRKKSVCFPAGVGRREKSRRGCSFR